MRLLLVVLLSLSNEKIGDRIDDQLEYGLNELNATLEFYILFLFGSESSCLSAPFVISSNKNMLATLSPISTDKRNFTNSGQITPTLLGVFWGILRFVNLKPFFGAPTAN